MEKSAYILVILLHKYRKKRTSEEVLFCGDPLGARTQDPNIKSVVLYQLS